MARKRLGGTPGQRVDAAMGRVAVGSPDPAAVVPLRRDASEATAALSPHIGLASPFAPTPNHLNAVVWHDLYDADTLPLTRAAAVAVPAVARSRHLICGKIASMPLRVFRGETELPDQPSWTYRADYGLPPYHRMLWTVDDLIFHGWSLWVARRGAPYIDGGARRPGPILEADRVAIERWKFTADRRIVVDDKPVNADDVILIPGPHEGLLQFAAGAVKQAADLNRSATKRAANPSAYIELHHTGETPLSTDEIDALTARWAQARRGENGGVAYTNKWIEVKEHGAGGEHLLIEGRNAAAVDVARAVSVPAAMIDATNATASLTYETTQGRNAEFIDYGLALYMDPITARLSMDDVVPRGQSVRFDTSQLRDLAPSPTGPATED